MGIHGYVRGLPVLTLAFFMTACGILKPVGDGYPPECAKSSTELSVYFNFQEQQIAVCGYWVPGNDAQNHMQFAGLYHIPDADSVENLARSPQGVMSVLSQARLNPADYAPWAAMVFVPKASPNQPAEVDALVGMGAEQQWTGRTIGFESRLVPVDPTAQERLLAQIKNAKQRKQGTQARKIWENFTNQGLVASIFLEQSTDTLNKLCFSGGGITKPYRLPKGWAHAFTLESPEKLKDVLHTLEELAFFNIETAKRRLPVRPQEYVVNPDGTLRQGLGAQ